MYKQIGMALYIILSALLVSCGGQTPQTTIRAPIGIYEIPSNGSISIETNPGQYVRMSVVRSYRAASGRDCLILENPVNRERVLYCRNEDSGWQISRPLLRGGAIGIR